MVWYIILDHLSASSSQFLAARLNHTTLVIVDLFSPIDMGKEDDIATEECEYVRETADSESSRAEKGPRPSNAVIDVESEDYVVTFKTWIVVSSSSMEVHLGRS